MIGGAVFLKVYKTLLKQNGHQGWWPGGTDFEICVGAILTQNTSWSNVEKAISNLKKEKLLNLEKMTRCSKAKLSLLIKPSGYFNQKATYLYELCSFLKKTPLKVLRKKKQSEARYLILGVKGVGKETADSIMLYALGFPVFVVDTYTKRIFSRIGLSKSNTDYDELQDIFHKRLKHDPALFGDYHAQLVALAKAYCTKKPKCKECPLRREHLCKYVQR